MDDFTCLNNIKNINYCTACICRKYRFHKKKGILSLLETGEVMGQSEMMVVYCVSDCSSFSCVSRVGHELPNGHLYPGLCPAVSQVIKMLQARVRIGIRGQQIGLAGVPFVIGNH